MTAAYMKEMTSTGATSRLYKNPGNPAIVEANSRVIELNPENIDIAFDIPANDVERLENNKDTAIVKRASTIVEYMVMNVTKKPLDDKRQGH